MPIHENFRKSTLEHRGAKEGTLPALGNGHWLLKNLLHCWFLRGKTWQVGTFVFCLGEPSSAQPHPTGVSLSEMLVRIPAPLSQAPQAEELEKEPIAWQVLVTRADASGSGHGGQPSRGSGGLQGLLCVYETRRPQAAAGLAHAQAGTHLENIRTILAPCFVPKYSETTSQILKTVMKCYTLIQL